MNTEEKKTVLRRVLFETKVLDMISESMPIDITNQLKEVICNGDVSDEYIKVLVGDLRFYAGALGTVCKGLNDFAESLDSGSVVV